ncbi:MAG: peptide ABC transporter substrate-binding protein [Anaerolineales bacterium]|jgi:peptide/nickel transport system substrate-binding protein
MIKKRKFWLLLAVLILAAFALDACAPAATEAPAEPTTPQEPAATEEEAPPPEVEPTEAPLPEVEPTESPPSGEPTTAIILIPEDPVAFNGLITDTGYEQMVGELVMLSLAEADPMGNIFPELAAELPTLENGGVEFDEDTWTMAVTWKLRDDVYWADGEQVTADDVIFTWNTIAEQAWTDGVDYTESLEKIDDFTFKVNYYEGYVFPNYLLQFGGENFFVYPEHYCDAEQGFYEWDCDKQPLSDGPYMLDEWVTNDHLTFVRNPNYFEEGKPAIDRIIVQIVPEQSVRETIMLEGDADIHYWPGDESGEVYKVSDNVDFMVSPTERWVMRLIPNLAAYGEMDPEAAPHPFLSDVRVRQAIRMAIDVDTIVNEIHYGNGEPMWTEFFRPPYECDIPRPAYDPEAAAALLEEAGWVDTDGDGIRECQGCPNAEDGTPMTMEFAIYSEYGEALVLAQQYIAENLADIGIGTELLSIEGAVMWAPSEDGGTEQSSNFELDMWDDGYPGVDPTDYQLWAYYYSEATEENGGFNVGHYANPDFDALLDEAYTLDEDYRKEIFCEIAQILDEDLPQILLYTTLEVHGVNTRLDGVQPSVNDPLTWNVADWTISE